jgi:hypothetical protein
MRRGVNLEAQLDAYEASSIVGSSAAAKKQQRTWPVYAAAAGASLAMATSAEASIIYSGPLNLNATLNGTPFDTNQFVSFKMKSASLGARIGGDVLGPNNSSRNGNVDLGNSGFAAHSAARFNQIYGASNALGQPLAKRMAFGARISSNSSYSRVVGGGPVGLRFASNGTFLRPPAGSWTGSKEGFVGVELRPFLAASKVYFGWIGIRVENDSHGVPIGVTVIDWAYNTVAGQGLYAGTLTAVPEPNTMVLALLATGSAGVLAWRKRKAELSEVTEASDGAEAVN